MALDAISTRAVVLGAICLEGGEDGIKIRPWAISTYGNEFTTQLA